MSIARINHFRSKEGQDDNLWQLLQSVVSLISSSPGCELVRLLRKVKDPTRLAIVEIWDTRESHTAAAARVPHDLVEKATEMLDLRPRGEFYQIYTA